VNRSPSHAAIGREFVWFMAIGVVGFLVDAALFASLNSGYEWSIGAARAVSASCSIVTTWALNRRFTFAARRSRLWRAELARYVVGQGAGLIVNLGTFALILRLAPSLRSAPIIALALGATAALLFNFLTARVLAFRPDAR
jgi:putative flippase GtrA